MRAHCSKNANTFQAAIHLQTKRQLSAVTGEVAHHHPHRHARAFYSCTLLAIDCSYYYAMYLVYHPPGLATLKSISLISMSLWGNFFQGPTCKVNSGHCDICFFLNRNAAKVCKRCAAQLVQMACWQLSTGMQPLRGFKVQTLFPLPVHASETVGINAAGNSLRIIP